MEVYPFVFFEGAVGGGGGGGGRGTRGGGGRGRGEKEVLETNCVCDRSEVPCHLMCGVVPCVQTMLWLPLFSIYKVRADCTRGHKGAHYCTRGLYEHHTTICTETSLRDKNPLPHRGCEPALAARRTRRLAQLTEVHLRPTIHSNWQERKLGKPGKTVENGQHAKPIRLL